jgi:hypothetical protein
VEKSAQPSASRGAGGTLEAFFSVGSLLISLRNIACGA